MRASKVDANHAEIVAAFRACGCSVVSTARLGNGFPDLIVAKDGLTWLVEVKAPKGQLRPDQVAFRERWQGEVYTVRTADDAIEMARGRNAPWR